MGWRTGLGAPPRDVGARPAIVTVIAGLVILKGISHLLLPLTRAILEGQGSSFPPSAADPIVVGIYGVATGAIYLILGVEMVKGNNAGRLTFLAFDPLCLILFGILERSVQPLGSLLWYLILFFFVTRPPASDFFTAGGSGGTQASEQNGSTNAAEVLVAGHHPRDGSASDTPAAPVPYASFWERLAAWWIDWLLVVLGGCLVVGLAFRIGLLREDETSYILQYVVFLVCAWIYWAGMESAPRRATLGKLAMRIQVVDLDGRPLSFWRATGRYWAKWLSFILLYVGILMIAATPRSQGLHDILAGSLVIKRERNIEIGEEEEPR